MTACGSRPPDKPAAGRDTRPARDFSSRRLQRRHHGRQPVGYVKADCDFPHCLTASHLMDDLLRRTLYMQMRALEGLYGHWSTCPRCGTDWETWGRVQPNLQIYCGRCSARRTVNKREA